MTSAQQLEQIFGVVFEPTPQPSLTALRQFRGYDDTREAPYNAFCEDEEGRVIGVCAYGNSFSEIKIPDGLRQLTYLNLSKNSQLEKLTFEKPLTRLEHMDVSDCGLQQFGLPAGFDRLKWLDLSRNKLVSFVPKGSYSQLSYLDLSDNELRVFRADWIRKFPVLKGLYLKKNALSDAKKSITDKQANCLQDMRRFLRSLEQGATKNKECKVLVVGDGHVGKSCLVERLVHNSFEHHHHSTQGIAWEVFNKENTDDYPYILNIWDFGGQELYHATHRLFMHENALYLLLWDQYSQDHDFTPVQEKDRTWNWPNKKLPYWLHYINVFGKNSPVLVIKSKAAGNDEEHPQRPLLRKIYEGRFLDLKFLKLDSRYPTEAENDFDDLKRAIKRAIEKSHIDQEIPQSWDDIRKWLRSQMDEEHKTLPLEKYLAYAQENGEGDQAMDLLQNWLIPTGVVFFKKGYFKDQIILDQNWAINAVYSILDRKDAFYKLKDIQREQYYFQGKDLINIWRDKGYTYTEAEMELLVDFMLSCELCFEVEAKEDHSTPLSKRKFVAPQLLPEKMPNMVNLIREQPNMLYLRYRHQLLHDGIIQSFIVQTSQLAALEEIWNQGIIIQEEKVRAVVWANKEQGKESIVAEIPDNGQELLIKIRDLLETLQKDLPFTQEVGLDGDYYVDLKTFENCKEPKIMLTHGSKSKQIDTERLAIFRKEARQAPSVEGKLGKSNYRGKYPYSFSETTPSNKPKVFISYAHGEDSRYVKLFINGLKKHSDWEVFTDQEIKPGEKWHEAIQDNVKTCDFAILLLSAPFFKSQYIYDHELTGFMQRHEKEGFLFVPLMLTECDFTQWEEIAERQIFRPYGQDYGKTGRFRDKPISFDRLVDFNKQNGEVLPNPDREDYFRDFIEKVNQALP